MKRKSWAVYRLTDITTNSLSLLQSGFSSLADATAYMITITGRCVIMEYYE
jgi:hypothetical protein